jgi:hypothetical protein
LYVFYPVARLNIGGEVICANSRTYTFRPESGDRILIFAYYPPLDTAGGLIFPEAEQLFFEDRQGNLFVPDRLRGDTQLLSVASLDDLAELLKQKLEEVPSEESKEERPR